MKSLPLYVAVAAAVAFTNCKKDKQPNVLVSVPEQPAAQSYDTYSALKVGNYWVYDVYRLDSAGNSTSLNTTDSCYIQKDTVIHNNTFFKMYRPASVSIQSDYSFVRDSLHYIINSSGQIIFSSQDFTGIFARGITLAAPNDTFMVYTAKMEDKDKLISVPAGSFNTSNFKVNYVYRQPTPFGKVRPMNYRYAKNTGIITETLLFYTSDAFQKERRLVRYHVN